MTRRPGSMPCHPLSSGLAPGGRGSRRCGRCAAARSRPAGSEPVAVGRVGRSRRHRAAPPRGFRNGSRACRLAGDRRRVRRRIRMARRSAAEAARAWLRHVELRARGSSSRRDLGVARACSGWARWRWARCTRGPPRRLRSWMRREPLRVPRPAVTPMAQCLGHRARPRDRHAAGCGVRGAVHVGRRRVRGACGKRASVRLRADREPHPAVLNTAWLSTGYLRGFLTGTELPPLWRDRAWASASRQSAPLSGSRKSRRRWRRSICCSCSSSSCSSATSSVATHLSR